MRGDRDPVAAVSGSRQPRTRRLLLGVTMSALLLAGCGSSKPSTINSSKVEAAIADSIHSERRIAAAAFCPSGMPFKAHFEFYCLAEIGARNTPFLVTETDGAGHVSYVGITARPGQLLNTRTVQRAIRDSIAAKKHLTARVRCPTDIPIQQGLSFVCAAETAGGQTAFDVKQIDSKGHVTYAAR